MQPEHLAGDVGQPRIGGVTVRRGELVEDLAGERRLLRDRVGQHRSTFDLL